MSTVLRTITAASLVLLLVLGVCAQEKKYDIKSGIVTLDVIIDVGKMKITNRMIVSFDEYGMKECRESYEEGKLRETFFSDGTSLWTLIHRNKEAYHRGVASRGTELRASWEDVPEKDKKEGKAKLLAPMTIAGRKCDAFTMVTSNGNVTYAGWKNVLLFMGLESKDMKMVTRAVKFDEHAPVPAAKFTVPAGYTKKQSLY